MLRGSNSNHTYAKSLYCGHCPKKFKNTQGRSVYLKCAHPEMLCEQSVSVKDNFVFSEVGDVCMYIPQKTEVPDKNVLRMFEAQFWKKYKNVEPR